MSGENSKEQSWIERLQYTYRLVVMNNETFEETGSYQLTLLNVYIMISTIVVLVAFAVLMLIAFTPLKRYIPGYGDVDQIKKVLTLQEKLEDMEEELEAQRTYTESFKRILVANVEAEKDMPKVEEVIQDSSISVKRIKEDEQLRRDVQLEDIGASSAAAPINRSASLQIIDQRLEQMYFVAPITGEISADFMLNKKHFGVDVLAPKNTAIKATLDGFVFMSDWTLETGNTIGIQHTNNVITFYKHNSVLLKDVGSYVKAGEAVAIIGNTGTLSDGPHLHFELWYKGKPVNPTDYINF